MKSWIENSRALTLINTMDEAQTEQCRGKLIHYINQYQENYPFDILDDVQTYMQLKLDANDLNFNVIPDEIKQAITEGYYEYCISLNEISAAYMIVTKSTPLTRLDLIQFTNHLLEAYSCNYPENEFLVPRLAEFVDLFAH
ncbi:hypothetical protein MMK73_003974 [Providencia rettgeri]|uniref:hypothetical protein n=1 Tax=Providencia sp. TaxID=589 RepID=UPI00334245CE